MHLSAVQSPVGLAKQSSRVLSLAFGTVMTQMQGKKNHFGCQGVICLILEKYLNK